ncbi:MAG: ester cyclase [Geminicoccaceae bacterium]
MKLSSLAVALMVSVLPVSAKAGERTTAEQRNVRTVLRLFDEGWGANADWETVWRETMTPDFTYYFHSHPPQVGLEDAITFNRALFAGFPGLEVSVEEIVVEGDVVVVRSRLTGAQDGVFLGVPPSGEIVDVSDVTLVRFVDGLVAEQHYFTDLLAVMTTIGAVPKPSE